MAFSFRAFNNDFLFELPEGLWDPDNFIKPSDAREKYLDDIIPIIAYGVNQIDKSKSPKAVSDKSGWIATTEELINVPAFQIAEIEAMMEDWEAVDACRSGHMGATISEYTNSYGDFLKFVWCDR